MIEQISAFFTVEMIYMWLNIGVIPFWLMLIIFPQTKVCGLFVTSIIPTFILASVYVYLLYIFFFAGYDFDKNFILYLSFYDLAELFENNEFLILFWTHFLAINLFCAGGLRSALATKSLKDMGFEKISHIDGGFSQMKSSGFKVEK